MIENSTFEVLPTTTIGKLFGSQITEPNLSLSTAPLIIAKISRGNISEYLACLNQPLTRSTLYPFLEHAAPNKVRRAEIIGVIGDWEAPDQESFERRKKMHEKLGDSWNEFERNRKLYLETISSFDRLPRNEHHGPLKTLAQVRQDFLDRKTHIREDDLRRLIQSNGLAGVRDALAKFIKTTPKARRSRQIQEADLAKTLDQFTRWGAKNRSKTLQSFVSSTDGDTQEQFLQEYALSLYKTFMARDKHEKPVMVYAKEVTDIDATQQQLDGVTVRYGNILVEGAPTVFGNSIQYLPKSIHYGKFIMPVLHWATKIDGDNTSREWLQKLPDYDNIPPEFIVIAQNWAINPSEAVTMLNPLAGLLTIAYFSQDVVNSWPQFVGLPTSNMPNFMGPAQVPVLALIRKNDLLRGSFLGKIEQYAS